MRVRVVLDTNVLISARLTGAGSADMAVQLILQGAATLLVDSRILAEYDEVTSRTRYGFAEAERQAVLGVLELIAEPVVAKPLRLTLPDSDDRVFVEVALAGRANVIVTGNVKQDQEHRIVRYQVRLRRSSRWQGAEQIERLLRVVRTVLANCERELCKQGLSPEESRGSMSRLNFSSRSSR